jgi:hypothetical protein
MNPTYQQGLFTAAQSAGSFPRRQREAEQFKQLTSGAPVGSSAMSRINQLQQLAMEAANRGQTGKASAYTTAAKQLQTTIKTQGANDIANLMQQIQTSVDPMFIKETQQQIMELATSTMQSDPTKFVGLGGKRIQEVDTLLETVSERRIESVANALAASEDVTDIVAYVDQLPSIENNPQGFTQREKNALVREATGLRQVRDDHQTLVSEGVLPEGHKEILDANPELKKNPQVQAALDVLNRKNDPKQTVSAGELRSAATTLRSVINNEYTRQATVNRSKDRLDAQAEKMVDRLLEEDSISEWVYGEDLLEVTRRISNDDDMSEDFYSFVAQEIEKNPDVDPQVAVKTAIDLLGEEREIDPRLEEGRELNKAEREQEAAEKEAAIVALMEREQLSREDAVLRLNQLEAEARRGQGSVSAIRERGRQEQFGSSPYAQLPEVTRGQDPVAPLEAIQGLGDVGRAVLTSFPGGPPSRNQ